MTRKRSISLLTAGLVGIAVAMAVVLMTSPTEVWAAASSVKVVGSATTVRPDDAIPADASNQADLEAAKNEFESFQVVIQAGDQPITGLRVDPGAQLTQVDANGNHIVGGPTIANSNVTVYREQSINIGDDAGEYPSDGEGATGEWPDALVPQKDYFYGQERKGFTNSTYQFDVPAGKKAVAWVDVLVPKTATAGNYKGSLTVTATGGLPQTTVPVNLEVLNFELLSTSSLQNAFFTQYGDACLAHTGNLQCKENNIENSEKRWRLHSLYARAALENRVTISNPVPLGRNEGPPTGQNLTYFNQYIAPLLKSDAQNSLRLPNAKLTSFSVFTYDQNAHCKVPECADQWETFASSNSFADRMFWYSCDEPGDPKTEKGATAWANCKTALTDQTGLPKLATAKIKDATDSGYLSNIDLLTPNVNRMHDKPNTADVGNQRDKYKAFRAADTNNRLWMYTSNMSFGSDGPFYKDGTPNPDWNSPYWNGWPGYAIDQPATQARAMGWMTFKYEADGELYWQTTQKLATAWANQYEQGGNGDGTLFYPGTPAKIGGTNDIPVESIRLKRIRDGREDYEYLKFLADRGKGSEAGTIANIVFPVMYDATATQTELDNARNDLIGLIKPLLGEEGCQGAAATITGTGGNDTLTGTDGVDVIVGLSGDDTIFGGGGNDKICGGEGYDTISGGLGDDALDGGVGLDALEYGKQSNDGAPVAGGVKVDLAARSATGEGIGTDTLVNPADFTEVYGSPHNDVIVGDENVNYLNGRGGADTITGGPGDDWLLGGDGDDAVNSRDGAPDKGGLWPNNNGVDCGAGAADTVTADPEGTDEINADCEPANIVYPPDPPPNTAVTSGPAQGSVTKVTSASFGFSSTEADSKFQCSLDGAVFGSCASPKGYVGLASKTHTFRVRAIDAAGNVDATPAVRSWTVDAVLPTVSGMSPKNASVITDVTPTIKATVRDNLTNLQKANIKLYVNGVLISPLKYSYNASTDALVYNSPKVAKGKKTVKVVATDAAKNVRTTSWYFTIK